MAALDHVAGDWVRSAPVVGVIGWIAVCLMAVVVTPTAVLLVGPLVLGIPHVLSELRVLSRRVQMNRVTLCWVLAPLVLLILLRVSEQSGMERPSGSDVVLGCVAMLAAAIARPGDSTDRLGRVLIVVGVSVLALYDTRLTTLVLAHLHNLIALLFLFLWSRSMRGGRAVVLIAGMVLAAGALGLAAKPSEPSEFISGLQQTLAPGLSAATGYWLVLTYAFAQLIHYVTWLVWIPAVKPAAGTPGSRRGGAFIAALIIVAMGLPMLAAIESPIALRDQYLALSSFHGWLELTVLAYCGVRGHAA